MAAVRIRTERLDLFAATLAHVEAELESPNRVGELLGAEVPASWPPGEYDRSAMEFFRARLSESPDAAGWYGWYAVLRPGPGEAAVVIGAGGYLGPPSPEGVVEVGYSIAPEYRARAFATELVQALVAHAFSDGRVVRVIAHTSAANAGSIKVLERCGFVLAGEGGEPETREYETQRRPDGESGGMRGAQGRSPG
jgi:ribosomal-protein-alanine N-acetyltransferase